MSPFVRWISLFLIVPVTAQDIPYGIEFVAGIRSGYHQKGVRLADDLIDLQIQSNITLNKTTSCNIALWEGSEISGDFREFGVLSSITKTLSDFSFTGEVAYYNYESVVASSGLEVTAAFDYAVNEEFSLYGALGYHGGAESFIGLLGVNGSTVITEDSFIELKTELHLANDYFSRSGLYDLTTRVNYTYNINSSLSMTPFLSASIPLDGEDEFDTSAGVWIEVFF